MKKQVSKLALNKITVANIDIIAIEDVKGGTTPGCIAAYLGLAWLGMQVGMSISKAFC